MLPVVEAEKGNCRTKLKMGWRKWRVINFINSSVRQAFVAGDFQSSAFYGYVVGEIYSFVRRENYEIFGGY